ncbi:RNA polymerase sigma factor [Pedobacter antarcticus]|uniref:RNA polymerase sigma factor n=1 Tax=Pedobacter antarcticus TaxID=34086 RepID=UPI00088F733F|nr:sigma-70 family RNA polymerase sigma factor [Pedobacter antarcticus]SDM49549.1 RNA polymerase sigma-70 factor, ECF subfamily [Pedobacter antarcticus]
METVYIDKHLALVDACRKGCRKSQFELYKLYERAMYNVALRIVNHEGEAEDVLQEAFLDAFTRLKDFRSETTFGLWLKQIVVNKSINCLRKRRAEFVSLDGVEAEDIPVNDEKEIQWRIEEIKSAIKLLPDGYRVVLTLYLFEGYDHEEISHILKISEVTSRSQLLRGKTKLKQLLAQKGVRDEY